MRLTLRTLLAYLDDTLEPAQAKLIGQKVAESDAAQELIARIKQVTRRRRLTTPSASGSGARTDPNAVAEYLDNTLAAEQLAEVEEVCLASDVHLAEIAACHQILTLVVGEPALVPPTSRQRMYGLVKGPEAIPFRKPSARTEAAGEAADEGQEADETLRLGLPAYRRQGGGQRLALIGGALALLALLAVAIWQVLPRSRSGPDKGEGEAGNQQARAADGTKPRNQDGARPADKKPRDNKGTVRHSKDSKDSKERVPVQDGRQDRKKPDKGARDQGPADRDGKAKPRDDEGNPEEKPPHTAIPDTAPRVVARYAPPTGKAAPILVRKPKGQDEWQRLERNNPEVSTGDSLVSLPGYRSEVRFQNGVLLTLWGDLPEISLPELSGTIPLLESYATIHDPKDFDLDLTLGRGRIVLANQKRAGKARVRVRFANPQVNTGMDYWEITLPEKECAVSLELWGRYPTEVPFDRNPKTREGPETQLYLFVLKGQVSVEVDYTTYTMEEPPGAALIFWDSKKGPTTPKTIKRLPFWATQRYPSFPPQLSKKAQDYYVQMRAAMERALGELSISMSGKVVEPRLLQELKSDNPIKRVLVVRSFGAIDDLSNLLDGLIDKNPEVRQAAIEDLRHWIGLHARNDLVLYKVLMERKGCTRGEATWIMELLHSFSAKERVQPETYSRLIDYLKQDNERLRVLAYWHLVRLVPPGLKVPVFDPLGDSTHIEQAYEAWKKAIPDGTVPRMPRQPMPMPKPMPKKP